MKRLILVLTLLIASPAWACQYGMTGGPVASLGAVNSLTMSIGAVTPLGFTLPTTFASGSNTVTHINEAQVFVTSGVINVYADGTVPTASTTAGGAPFGSGAAGGTAFDVCGERAIGLTRMISQSGTATVVILYGGN